MSEKSSLEYEESLGLEAILVEEDLAKSDEEGSESLKGNVYALNSRRLNAIQASENH